MQQISKLTSVPEWICLNTARGHYITRNVFEILLKKLNIDIQLAGLHEESSIPINAGNKTLTQHPRIKYIYMKKKDCWLDGPLYRIEESEL